MDIYKEVTDRIIAQMENDIIPWRKSWILGSITVDCRNGEMDCMSVAFLQMVGVFSEVELQMTQSRVRSGLANCRRGA